MCDVIISALHVLTRRMLAKTHGGDGTIMSLIYYRWKTKIE